MVIPMVYFGPILTVSTQSLQLLYQSIYSTNLYHLYTNTVTKLLSTLLPPPPRLTHSEYMLFYFLWFCYYYPNGFSTNPDNYPTNRYNYYTHLIILPISTIIIPLHLPSILLPPPIPLSAQHILNSGLHVNVILLILMLYNLYMDSCSTNPEMVRCRSPWFDSLSCTNSEMGIIHAHRSSASTIKG